MSDQSLKKLIQQEEATLGLTLQLAKDDSPIYRASLHRIEDEVEKITSWIESLCKTLKTFLEETNRYNDASNQFASKVLPVNNPEIIDSDYGFATLRTFAEALQCIYSFQAKMVDDLQEYLLLPLTQFNREDLKVLKDQRRNYERTLEKYESSVKNYFSLSKFKDVSSLREDAFQLYEVRKVYIRTSLEYCAKTIRFKYILDRLILDRFSDAMDSIMDFFMNASEVYKGLKPTLEKLKINLDARLSYQEGKLGELEAERINLESSIIASVKPNTSLPSSTPQVKVSTDNNTPIEKEGYLLKRIVPKSSLVVPTWSRRWCFIKDGKFGFCALAKSRGNVASSPFISVLLCEVKVDDKQDRRYCFEIISSKKSFLLQAETEEELTSWLAVFEAARLSVMKVHKGEQLLKLDEKESSSRLYDEDEWDVVSTPPIIERKFIKIASRNASLGGSGERFLYPNLHFERKNKELHSVVPSIPLEEKYLDSFSASLLRETQIQGRLYLTQFHICFYSNILNFITNIVIPFEEIKSIHRNTEGLLVVQGKDAKYEIKSMHRKDIKAFGALNTALWNFQSDNPMSLQELFDTIQQNYGHHKDDEIEEEKQRPGSIPLALKSGIEAPVNEKKSAPNDWPAGITVPSGEVSCGCSDHYEKVEVNVVLPISASKLFNLIYESNDFMKMVHRHRNDVDLVISEWSKDDKPKRELRWTFAVNHPMVKSKTTECIETNTILKRDSHICYIVDVNSKTPLMPYGDSFYTVSRFCISFVTEKTSRFHVSVGVHWIKHPLVKPIIKSEAMKGMQSYLQDYLQLLRQEVSKVTGIESSTTMNQNSDSLIEVETKNVGEKKLSSSASGYPLGLRMILFIVSISMNIALLVFIFSNKVVSNDSLRNVLLTDLHQDQIDNYEVVLMNDTRLVRKLKSNLRLESYENFRTSMKKYIWFDDIGLRENEKLERLKIYSSKLRKVLYNVWNSLDELDVIRSDLSYYNWLSDRLNRCKELEKKKEVIYYEGCKRIFYELIMFERMAEEEV